MNFLPFIPLSLSCPCSPLREPVNINDVITEGADGRNDFKKKVALLQELVGDSGIPSRHFSPPGIAKGTAQLREEIGSSNRISRYTVCKQAKEEKMAGGKRGMKEPLPVEGDMGGGGGRKVKSARMAARAA